jgi:hypothetical protein
MTLTPEIERLLRELAEAVRPAIAQYREDVVAGTKYSYLQFEPIFVTDRPHQPLLYLHRPDQMLSWRSQMIPGFVPWVNWFYEFDHHPLKKQLVAELRAFMAAYLPEVPEPVTLEGEGGETSFDPLVEECSRYIDFTLMVYHALHFRLGPKKTELAFELAADQLDARVNPQRAHMVHCCYLYALELDEPEELPIAIGDGVELRLSTLDDIVHQVMYDAVQGKYLPPAYMLSISTRLNESATSFPEHPDIPTDALFGDVLTAFRLYKTDYIGRGNIFDWESGPPTGIGRFGFVIDDRTASMISNGVRAPTYKLTVPEVERIADIYKNLRQKGTRSKLRVALSRFNGSYRRHDPRERIIDLIIAMENLFGDETVGQTTEVGYRLRLRAARYLGEDADQRMELFYFIRDLYELRSKIVHGTSDEIDEIEKKLSAKLNMPMGAVVSKTKDLVRQALVKLIANPSHIGSEFQNKLLLDAAGVVPDNSSPE